MVSRAAVALGHGALQGDSAFYRVNRAIEFRPESIADIPENPAVVPDGFPRKQLAAACFKPTELIRAVGINRPVISNRIGGKDRCKATLAAFFDHEQSPRSMIATDSILLAH
jgi:hypothetical protein